MLIRDAQSDDFEPIAALSNHFIINTPIHFGYDTVTAEDFIRPWEATRDRYPWLIAEIDGHFAGFAKAGVWRERAAYSNTAETAVYVELGMGGRGVGRALYTELLNQLRARGYHLAVAGITLPNEASVRLHERVGFEYVGTFRECGRKFDAWHDVGWWQLPLSNPSALDS